MKTTGVEILSIGDELLRGEVINTNASWLARALLAAGAPVGQIATVGDDVQAICKAVVGAGDRCDTLIVTGGLGPTVDDRTAEAIARAAGVELEVDSRSLAAIEDFFRRLGRAMTPNNARQAILPRGAEGLQNTIGTAPGFTMGVGSCQLFALPGVPREMRAMFETSLLPRLARQRALCPAVCRTLRVFGWGESELDAELSELGSDDTKELSTSLHFRTTFPENHVTLVARPARADQHAAAVMFADRWVEKVRGRIGWYAYGNGDQSLAAVVVNKLRRTTKRVALAESCSGGLVADRITDVPGASEVFQVGLVVYSEQSKETLLGISADLLAQHGAVSRECVEAMATQARDRCSADIGLAVSGLVGPAGDDRGTPVGTVHFALAGPGGVSHCQRRFDGERRSNKIVAAEVALWLLYLHLEGLWPGDGDPLRGRWSAS